MQTTVCSCVDLIISTFINKNKFFTLWNWFCSNFK